MDVVDVRSTQTPNIVDRLNFRKVTRAITSALKTPTVILSLVSLSLLFVLPKVAGVLLLFVGSGGVGISWWQFQLANELDANVLRLLQWRSLRAWGCWFNALAHLPMLIAGILLLFAM